MNNNINSKLEKAIEAILINKKILPEELAELSKIIKRLYDSESRRNLQNYIILKIEQAFSTLNTFAGYVWVDMVFKNLLKVVLLLNDKEINEYIESKIFQFHHFRILLLTIDIKKELGQSTESIEMGFIDRCSSYGLDRIDSMIQVIGTTVFKHRVFLYIKNKKGYLFDEFCQRHPEYNRMHSVF